MNLALGGRAGSKPRKEERWKWRFSGTVFTSPSSDPPHPNIRSSITPTVSSLNTTTRHAAIYSPAAGGFESPPLVRKWSNQKMWFWKCLHHPHRANTSFPVDFFARTPHATCKRVSEKGRKKLIISYCFPSPFFRWPLTNKHCGRFCAACDGWPLLCGLQTLVTVLGEAYQIYYGTRFSLSQFSQHNCRKRCTRFLPRFICSVMFDHTFSGFCLFFMFFVI